MTVEAPSGTPLRVLHAGCMSEVAVGVVRQLEFEQAAAVAAGLRWTSRLFVGEPTDSPVCVRSSVPSAERVRFRRDYYRWLSEAAAEHDVVVLRYAFHDPWQLRFLARAVRPVFLVHHTLEEAELARNGSVGGRLKLALERLLGPLSLRRARGLVAVTDEILNHELERRGGEAPPTHRFPNGVLWNETPVIAPPPPPVPTFLFVSSVFVDWQGLDLLLDGARLSGRAFVCHVVGRVSDAQAAAIDADPRFRRHGTLDAAAIAELTAAATVGLGAFALDRKRMEEACTLKVREYLHAGLPVYAGHRDVFPAAATWFRNGPPDVEAICRYSDSMRDVGREDVRAAARPWIDKRSLVADADAFLVDTLDATPVTGKAIGHRSALGSAP